MTKVEIAICTFNRAQHLDRCLSVLSRQTAPHDVWTVLVVDNASTDNTAEVVDRHAKAGRIPGLRHVYEARPGLTSARQCAMRHSPARFVAFVDDDCQLDPKWITELAGAIKRYPDAAAFGGRVVINWAATTPASLRKHGWIFAEQPHGIPGEEGEVGSLVGAGIVLNRTALQATGWIDAPLIEDRIGRGATSGGDVEIGLRLRQNGGKLFYIPSMKLDHMIAADRQSLAGMLELSHGLGMGAAFVTALENRRAGMTFCATHLRASRKKIRALFLGLIKRDYSRADWKIYRAFERGKLEGLRRLASDPSLAGKFSN